ncbi:MAG: hypothetical protein OXR73_38765, partial [Myxococcales bacterium]|nr:hypothetical protein [Myxococcales bacterium]
MSALEAAVRLAPCGGLCWLDGDGGGPQGRYSFVASQPVDTTIVTVETPDPFARLARLSTPDAPGADGAGTAPPQS